MSFYSISSVQKLPISLDEAWEFFSTPKNLNEITPPDMGFSITNEPGEKMYQGQIITYRVGIFPMVKINWMTEITVVRDKGYFVDEQRFGPYALWHHQHHFKAIEGGVEMRDIVNYKLPLGFLGKIAHWLFVKKKLEGIFSYRFEILDKKFGSFKE
jgi:ligand-binding SRPBCC domain-containing protein